MKTFLKFILFIFLIPQVVYGEVNKLQMDGRVRYFSTLVDDLGTRYDDTRPGPVLDLNFTYPINDNLSIKNFNNIINYEDTTSGDETMNIEINQRLGLLYKRGATLFYPYGKMVWHDKNPAKQVDNSHLGLAIQQYFSKDVYVVLDYREELSNGALLAGVRHSENVFESQFHKKNLFQIINYPVHLKLAYAKSPNLRKVSTIKFDMDITKRLEFSIKYVDNKGIGPISPGIDTQNQNFLVANIGYKF